MNQFPTLIEYLLLNHDYVVIPEVGTFIVQQMDAQRNEGEEAFLPPYRSVRFNAGLKQNDNLLVSSIEETFAISSEQAYQQLTMWVSDFRQTLEDNGCAEFGSIGIFTIEENGTMTFSAQESGVTTPEYYGLDAFHISEVAPVQKTRMVPRTASMEANDHEITIRINRRIANYVVAACAAILLFVVFNNPIPNIDLESQRSSLKELLIPNNTTPQQQVSVAKVETPKVAEDMPKATETEASKTSEQTPAQPTAEAEVATETAEEYCIVLASAISKTNAERFVERLTADGFISARIIMTGKMLRVVVGHYTDKEQANKDARSIRQRSAAYSSAWVRQI